MKIAFYFLPALFLVGCGNQEPVVSSGKIDRIADFPSENVAPRNVDVWLPEGYDSSTKYAVIYMHDGQMLFDSTTTWNKQEWKVDEVVTKLIDDGRISPCIVVGIWNNGDYRHTEYFPRAALDGLAEEEATEITRKYLKNEALSDKYLKFIVDELKPYIDSHYSTGVDRGKTYTMGASMGGLISLYAICEYPDVFGGAGCLSTHWPLIDADSANNSTEIPIVKSLRNYLAEHLPSPADHKIYFDYGTATLDALYEPHQLLVDEIMASKGFNSENWMTKKYDGDDHSELSWSKRLAIPLTFLLATDQYRQ
ncbi:MAG: esterase family protein [Bacteroidales bacterium]|nr:esterase family protein [Bacteroidales bacterium]